MKRKLGFLSGAPRVSTVPDAELTGPRSHVLGVIRAFESLGWEVNQFIVGDRVSRSWIKTGSGQVITRHWSRALVADLVRLILGVFSSYQAWQVLRHEVDWVYERFAVLQSLGWVFKQHGKLWILETNGLGYIEAKERNTLILTRLAKRLEFQAYRRCDYLVCVSNTLKEMILEQANISESKIIVLPNGVDTSLFDPAPHLPVRLFTGFTVGYAGSLVSRQNLDLLLDVIYELSIESFQIYLTVVGDGPMRELWEAHSLALGISARVRFVGQVPQEEVPGYIMGFDIGFSGHREPPNGRIFYSPLKVYEYLAMGVPVIASKHEDTERVIRDGEVGYLFKAGDKQHLKRVLKQAYEKREQLPQMGQRGRRQVVEGSSWVSRVAALIMQIEATMPERFGESS
jgi:glycosyltransferase involved in cell wall biosynthesis